MVDASKDEAALPVRLYNDPSEPRAFEGFVVHMHLTWLYLLHAELTRDGVEYRYWGTTTGRQHRLIEVDGEPKRWELARCVQERWNVDDPSGQTHLSEETDVVAASVTIDTALRLRKSTAPGGTTTGAWRNHYRCCSTPTSSRS